MAEIGNSPSKVANWIVPALIGLAGCVSINPYFLWHVPAGQMVIAAGLSAAAIVWTIYKKGYVFPRGIEALGLVILTLFLVYITTEYREDGGHSKWIVVAPTLWALALLPDSGRQRCLHAFITLFSITLIPGIIIWVVVALGVHVHFSSIPMANPVMTSATGGGLLYFPGAVFIEANSIVLKTGGILFRLCAIYDEPGTVGTIAALCLATVRFKLNNWRYILLYVAGVISFSLAFISLCAVGLLARAIFSKNWRYFLWLVPLLLSLSLTTGWIKPAADYGTKSNVTVKSAVPTEEAPRQIQMTPQQTLGHTVLINDRALPGMTRFMATYWKTGIKAQLFGIATDSSFFVSPGSQVFWRIFIDFGIIGFALILIGYTCIVFPIWIRCGYSWWGALLITLFAMSFYQRPIIWLPYGLIILICGIPMSSNKRSSSSEQ